MAISKIGSKALVDCSVAAVDIEDNSITSAKLAGSIANAKLANSNVTVNGTSISLGASGSIPAVSWQSVVTADGSTATSAVAGNGYFIDTTSAAHTINLPGSPSAGDTIAIKDYAGTFATNNLTIGRNGNNIQGVANDSLISTNRASIILVYSDATKGWLYTVESNVASLGNFTSATGGTVTTDGDYKIHTFTGDGCFVVSNVGFGSSVDYVVVAGGGAGGSRNGGSGGGGGGGYRESHCATYSGCYTASPLATPTSIPISVATYPITVGAGGAGNPGCSAGFGPSGSNSVFSTITSNGGGGGGGISSNNANVSGSPGGSGGGSGLETDVACVSYQGSGNTPPVSPPQGNDGGTNFFNGSLGPTSAGGGGGGAAGAGGNASSGTGGGRGDGAISAITGSPAARGQGGAAVYYGSPLGGVGGGNPSPAPDNNGVPGGTNTGGGGGAAGGSGNNSSSGSGGKGIVILRYKYQ